MVDWRRSHQLNTKVAVMKDRGEEATVKLQRTKAERKGPRQGAGDGLA